ncbi:unnamed protein product, partial [Mesorhabditis spiculigera]
MEEPGLTQDSEQPDDTAEASGSSDSSGVSSPETRPESSGSTTPVAPPENAARRVQPIQMAPPRQMLRGELENNNHFGAMRDRIYHSLFVRFAMSYERRVGPLWRQAIEAATLFLAFYLLATLFFLHYYGTKNVANCLTHLNTTWPRDGVLRVEVIRNLEVLEQKERWMRYIQQIQSHSSGRTCYFNPANVLRFGPASMPSEIRMLGYHGKLMRTVDYPDSGEANMSFLAHLLQTVPELYKRSFLYMEDPEHDKMVGYFRSFDDEHLSVLEEEYDRKIAPETKPAYQYLAEYSLLFGLLRLPTDYREKFNIPTMVIRIDADAKCLEGTVSARFFSFLAFTDDIEERITGDLRQLAKHEKDYGYLHDLRTNEIFHFIQYDTSRFKYIPAFCIMIILTFVISVMLRFSHHQIFLLIVDFLHMLETNHAVQYPAAPILTVILALVGLEAIMTELFTDTVTAFYMILIVWVADQYETICCHTRISKVYWLRFFYLYQFFFYAYQYRFGGQFSSVLMWVNATLTIHSMIFFFHHYELPHVIHQNRMQHILDEIRQNPVMPNAPAPAVRLINVHRLRRIINDPPEEGSNGHPQPRVLEGEHVSVAY